MRVDGGFREGRPRSDHPAGAAGPPLPVAANGNTVEVVGTGVPPPTAFAFSGQTVFAGSGPNEESGGPGGLFTLAEGKATKVAAPTIVLGVNDSSVYVGDLTGTIYKVAAK